jgi:hypothetical protein
MGNLEARVARLEANQSVDDYKPVDLRRFFAELAILLVGKPRKNESKLTAYARGARFRGGVAELFETAHHDPDKFYRKHAKVVAYPSPHHCRGVRLPPVMPTREYVEKVRRCVIKEFVVEELCWQLLEYIDATDATIAGFHVQKDGPVPLSPVRPMRPEVAV